MICQTCHNAVKDANWKRTGKCWKYRSIPLIVWLLNQCDLYDKCRPERCNCQSYINETVIL